MEVIFIIREKNCLKHHGVKGMKWGVRRIRNENGKLVLPKNTTVKRLSTSPYDWVWDNKKYVSINQEDHNEWNNYIGKIRTDMGQMTYEHTYKTNKDLKIMSSKKQGQLYANMLLLNPSFRKQSVKDLQLYKEWNPNADPTNDKAEEISRLISIRTETGKRFINKVLSKKYDALFDTHGTNVAKEPLIILDEENNITKTKTDYSDVVVEAYGREYLDERFKKYIT